MILRFKYKLERAKPAWQHVAHHRIAYSVRQRNLSSQLQAEYATNNDKLRRGGPQLYPFPWLSVSPLPQQVAVSRVGKVSVRSGKAHLARRHAAERLCPLDVHFRIRASPI